MFFSNKPEATEEMLTRITKGKTTAQEYGQALVRNGFIGLGNQIIDDANWDTATQLAEQAHKLEALNKKMVDDLESVTEIVQAHKQSR